MNVAGLIALMIIVSEKSGYTLAISNWPVRKGVYAQILPIIIYYHVTFPTFHIWKPHLIIFIGYSMHYG